MTLYVVALVGINVVNLWGPPPESTAPQAARRSEPVTGSPSEGRLEEMPFARLLGTLYRFRATGSLLVKKSKIKKKR